MKIMSELPDMMPEMTSPKARAMPMTVARSIELSLSYTPAFRGREPKMRVPTRTSVAPSSTAA